MESKINFFHVDLHSRKISQHLRIYFKVIVFEYVKYKEILFIFPIL
jgi:hypothetical protein